ncbi:hypothetical protein [Psychroflexus aestuariivivens]|uniref:hypothetical protein n=1 Tax=Psychroflexus aestuariivivens TaxID=1795040 RepID=UPI000FD6E506|nr:hypothetical protein [Psychroflexus aestuariivivens]
MCKDSEQKIPKSCRRVAEFSDKQQYEEASFWQKIRLQLHILNCERCEKYHQLNNALTKLIKRNSFEGFSYEEKQNLKAKLKIS